MVERATLRNFTKLWIRVHHKMGPTIMNAITIAIVWSIFSYNVYSNVSVYLLGHTAVYVSEVPNLAARFPPLIFCPFPMFDPFRLINVGLNISVDSASDLQINVESLNGLDKFLSGGELVEKAAWRFGDLVKEVRVGDFIVESYSGGNASSRLWHRSFTPMGPCWTLTVPADSSHHSLQMSVELHILPANLQGYQSRGKQIGRERSAVKDQIEFSSIWDEFLKYFYCNVLVYLSSTYQSFDIYNLEVERKISAKNYKLTPYRINRNKRDQGNRNSATCLHRIALKRGEDFAKCTPIYTDTLRKPIYSLCATTSQHLDLIIDYLPQSQNSLRFSGNVCQAGNGEFRWKIEDSSKTSFIINNLSLELTSPTALDFQEKALYPLPKVLEDIGGSLGLFLGISIFDIWLYMSKVDPLRTFGLYAETCKLRTLFMLSVLMATSIPFCVHFGMILNRYRSSSELFIVSLSDKPYSISNHSMSFKEVLLSFVASRPFGCQLISLPLEEVCLVRCLIVDIPSLPISSFYLDDLPRCYSQGLSLPKLKYVVEGVIPSSFSESKLAACSKQCKISNISFTSNLNLIQSQVTDFSGIDIVCSLGGILGLYYGFSMLGLLNVLKGRYFKTCFYNCRKLIILALDVFIIVVCVIFCAYPLQKYLFSHPIYTTYSDTSMVIKDLPMLTHCIWPPFNISKLLSELHLEEELRNLPHLDQAQKYIELTNLLRNLSYNLDSNNPDARDLWFKIAWNSGVFFPIGFKYNEYDTSLHNYSIFNSCHSVRFKGQQKINIRMHINQYWFMRNEDYHKNIAVNVFIHSQGDFLPLLSKVYPVQSHTNSELKRVSKWQGIHGSNEEPGNCLVHCLETFLTKKMGCSLPWMEKKSDMDYCSFHQFVEFLHTLWFIDPLNTSVLEIFLDKTEANLCKELCQSRVQYHYTMGIADEVRMGPGLAFSIESPIPEEDGNVYISKMHIDARRFEEFIDNDGYSVSQFVSEIGGMIGLTLGISLLSLLGKIYL